MTDFGTARRTTSAHARAFALVAWALVAACGPDLSEPAPSNVSGLWASADTAAGATDFKLVLSQSSDGAITGSWSGRGIVVNGACPPTLGCAPTNSVVGSNTVFQVFIDLLGAGPFTGQIENGDLLRGDLSGERVLFHRND